MRETRQSGSEGGAGSIPVPVPVPTPIQGEYLRIFLFVGRAISDAAGR